MNKKLKSALIEVVSIIGVVFVPFIIIHQFVARPFLVSGASMEPNFKNGNYLIVDLVSYHLGGLKAGDVVIFKYPGDLSTYYIKRVIALPGDTVKFSGGKTYVNGKELDEEYLPKTTDTESVKREFVLQKDEYFVMGDNRGASYDSRSWGPLPKEDVIGIVKVRVWPPFEIYRNINDNKQ